MVPKFHIEWLAADRLVALTLRGFWAERDVADFAEALLAVVSRAGGVFDLFADLSELKPQSAVVVMLQSDVLARLVAAGLRRTAIGGAAPLLTMQVKRAAGSVPIALFTSAGEARQWLTSPERGMPAADAAQSPA